MSESTADQVTMLLSQLGTGRDSVVDRLLPLVYDELRSLASVMFRRQRPDHTLQPTALVHEAYARLVKHEAVIDRDRQWASRAHFLAVAAKAMRQILANYTRQRRTAKRGGDWERITLGAEVAPTDEPDLDVMAIDEVLTRLAAMDPRQAQVVELRFFADMTVPEIAHVMSISTATVEREWRVARAWLSAELRKG